MSARSAASAIAAQAASSALIESPRRTTMAGRPGGRATGRENCAATLVAEGSNTSGDTGSDGLVIVDAFERLIDARARGRLPCGVTVASLQGPGNSNGGCTQRSDMRVLSVLQCRSLSRLTRWTRRLGSRAAAASRASLRCHNAGTRSIDAVSAVVWRSAAPRMRTLALILGGIVATALFMVGLVELGNLSHPAPTTSVGRYCEYGSVSAAQLAGCERHVTVSRVDALDTHAAEYGRYTLSFCMADAGPYCR